MENFERDMERSRLKKEVSQDLKSRWAVLLVNSTGKVHTISYLKGVLIGVILCFGLLVAALAVTATIASHTLKANDKLNKEIQDYVASNQKLKDENESLSARIALFDAAAPEKEENKEVIKVKGREDEKQNIGKPFFVKNDKKNRVQVKEVHKGTNLNVVKTEPKKENKNNSKNVEIKNYSILKNDNDVEVEFDIININDGIGPVSGYIFAILENDVSDKKEIMISPYSVLSGGLPVKPSSGQYFSISRFKPVKIKFPGNINLSRFSKVKIVVYSDDNKLLLEKGFKINEKN